MPIAERAGPLIEHCIARGSLYIRSHVDAQTLLGRRHIEDMLALRQRYAHLVDLQFVSFPQGGMLIAPGTTALMEQALEMGVDIVGGIDPAAMDRDPIRALETIFGMAQRALLPAPLARVSPRFLTPANAIMAYGTVVALLAVSGTFATLATFMVALEALVMVLAVLALPMLWRRKQFHMSGANPLVWGAVVLVALAFNGWLLLQAPASAVVPTIGVLLAGGVVYLLARRRTGASA